VVPQGLQSLPWLASRRQALAVRASTACQSARAAIVSSLPDITVRPFFQGPAFVGGAVTARGQGVSRVGPSQGRTAHDPDRAGPLLEQQWARIAVRQKAVTRRTGGPPLTVEVTVRLVVLERCPFAPTNRGREQPGGNYQIKPLNRKLRPRSRPQAVSSVPGQAAAFQRCRSAKA